MKRSREESLLQRACVDFLTIGERLKGYRFFAVPNGGKRDRITGALLKREGVRAGCPGLESHASPSV